jgi:hypothetical protein
MRIEGNIETKGQLQGGKLNNLETTCKFAKGGDTPRRGRCGRRGAVQLSASRGVRGEVVRGVCARCPLSVNAPFVVFEW